MKKVLAGVLAVMMTFSGTALPENQFWKGAGVISASAENWTSVRSLTSDMTVSGSVETNSDIILNGHTLTINGDLYMTAGMLEMGTGKLVVNGNLYIGKYNASSYAHIRMQDSSASITVTGDLNWNVAKSEYIGEYITAGTINLAGDVRDYVTSYVNPNAFRMSGTGILNLNGTGIQTIQGGYCTNIAKLNVTNNRTVDLEGFFYSATPLISDLNLVTQNGIKITRMVMGGKNVTITGKVIQFEKDIELGGGTLTINGDFIAEGGETKLEGGKLNVSGDYSIGKFTSLGELGSSDAGLDMSNSSDVVNVGGNFAIKNWAGSSQCSTQMTAGKMYVGGNFSCSSSHVTFGSGNTVYMNGNGPQTVNLTLGKKIYNLVLVQDLDKYNSDIANYAVKLVTNQPDISNGTVTLSSSSYTYDGTAKQPAVTVKLDGKTLIEGTDYTVTYSDNTNKGTASATAKGKGSYTGTVTKTFTINAANIGSAALSPSSYTYDGSAKTPGLTYNSRTLVKNTDYTVTYSNNTNAGTATASVTGKGNFTGTATKTFTISAKSASTLTMTVSPTNYTYDGSAKKPTVTVKDGSKTLVSGTDYTVSYSNNTNVGTATATITCKGNYTGTKSANFTIGSAAATQISTCTITLGTTSYTYDGTAKQPAVTVKNGSTTLSKGTDYAVSYSNNTNAGTATVTITGAGKYTGTATKTFTINAKSASTLTMTVSPTNYTYDGSAKKPTVTVKDGSKTLVSGTDYTVSYSNNTNVGTATATITCKGNYTGTKSANFTIGSAAATQISTCTITLGTTSYTYDGTAKQPTVTVKNGSTTLTKGTDYAVSYSNNTNAGTATVTITGAGKYTGTATKTFTINAKSASTLTMTVSPTNYTYDGSAKKPTVTVKDGSKTLVSGTDYTVSYSNNTNVGTATATITCKGNYTGTKSANFTIGSAAATQISTCTITLGTTSYTYDGTAKQPAVTVKNGSTTLTKGTDYIVSYINNTNAGTAAAVVSGAGKYTGTVNKTFTISAKNANSLTMTVSPTGYTYDGKPKTPSVTVKDGSVTLANGVDYTVSYSNNTNVGTATAKITCMGNYTGTKSANFTISKAAPVAISSGTVSLGTTYYIYDGTAKQPAVTVKYGTETLVNGTDYTVSYTNNTKAGTASVTITGKGSYTGTVTKNFTIEPKNVSGLDISVAPTSYTYDGKAKTPAVTVKNGSTTLVKDTDYTVSYLNNTAVGTATVTVTGKGNYSGSRSLNFTISEPAAISLTGCTASLGTSSYTYDGAAKQPSVTVKYGSSTLVKGTDYIVSYTNNINAGTATVTISGAGRYTGTLTRTFTINPKSVSGLTAVVSPSGYTYDGTARKPDITVSDGSRTLTAGKDYTVAYSNNVNVGTATVTIKGAGNYTGTLNKSFRISAKPVSDLEVTLSATSYTYDGSAKQPSVTVAYGTRKLVNGTDYTVSYSNNTKIGTATVTITGKGNFTGTKTAYFTINKAEAVNITNCKAVLDSDSFVYDGMAKKPSVTVKNGDKTLRSGIDYTYAYDNNINAGKGSVIVTGMGDYAGTGILRFTISPASVDNFIVNVLKNNYIYDGTEKKPGVVVTEGMNTMTEGVDYILTYGNNIAAGIGHVYVNGIGNYRGIKQADFAITAKDASSNDISECSIQLTENKAVYTGKAVTPDVIVRDGVTVLTKDVDYTVGYIANVNAGTAKVVITGMGSYTGIYEDSFEIIPKSSKGLDITLTPSGYEYDGKVKKPSVTVKDGSRVLTEKNDYTVTISDNMIAGNAVVKVSFTGNYSGTETGSFKIAASDISKASVVLEKYCYDANGSERNPSVTVEKDGRTLVQNRDYRVEYSSNVNAGTAYVTITGQGNYYGTIRQRFAIGSASAKSISGFRVTMDKNTFVYDGTAKRPTITITNGTVTLYEGQNFEVICENNTEAGKARIIAIGKNGYKDQVSAEYTISPKSISSAQAALSADTYEYDGYAKTPAAVVTLNGVKLAEGRDYTVAYVNNTAAGTASVKITGKGNYSGSFVKNFAIKGRNAACLGVQLEKNKYAFSGKEIRPAVRVTDGSKVLTAGTDYEVTYENNKSAGAARVVIKGKGNYVGMTAASFSITGNSTAGVMKGDVNGDGVVNVTDLSKIAAHIKSKKSLTGNVFVAADVNGDGSVNVGDLSRVAGHVKGKKNIK